MKKINRLQLRSLIETANPEFLKKLKALHGGWQSVQSSIPTKTEVEPHFGYYYDEKTGEHEQDWYDREVTYQVTRDEKKPSFTDEGPGFYDQRHPAERRVRYGQTQSEIDIERTLMSLWQEYAKPNMGFWKSRKITYCHSLSYKSAARGTRSQSVNLLDLKPDSTLVAQNQRMRDPISVVGIYTPNTADWPKIQSQDMFGGGWGFICSGHPIFASFEDVASQTQRMASQKAREYYASSGLPKRAGFEQVAMTDYPERRKKMMGRTLKRRKGFDDAQVEKYFEVMANPVVLGEEDILDRQGAGAVSTTINEIILAHWSIDAWYVDQAHLARSFFNKQVPAGNITKPIYFVHKVNQTMSKGAKRKFDVTDPRQAELFLKYLNRD
tara:strand:+ start:313 stop:1458 length:1146 start_codon:yes stop_codon:yes gene_type:complete